MRLLSERVLTRRATRLRNAARGKYAAGEEVKRFLLHLEGIRFDKS